MIIYDSPTLTEDINKPSLYENRGFPYHGLDPRRFEELIYALYKNEIGQVDFACFDHISLLSGTKDLGRDCVLIRDHKNYGLIQCKRYDKNLSVEDIGSELTKFILYSLLEPELIHDHNDFTYYVASARGFDNECIGYLHDFNRNIADDPRLEKWISKFVKTPSLQRLEFQQVHDAVVAILQQLKVRMISSNDLDQLLSLPRNVSVADMFFKIKTYIDEEGIKRIEGKLDEILRKRYTSEEMLDELKRGSSTVDSEKNYFEGIRESHIERTETTEIINWINSPAPVGQDRKPQNICLVAANAGMGKTVIIKDTYDILLAQQIPVLAIKADKVYVANFRELQDKLGLASPLHQLIDQCLQQHRKIVIMVDQIDALSQSLSGNRDFLSTYTQLITNYKGRENVRFVISVRFFDLYFDPGLRVYKNLKTIEVAPLSKDTVLGQLEKIGLRENNISPSLLALLQTPNNLDVFSRIFAAKARFSEINSLQDLYAELFRIKILSPTAVTVKSKALKEVLNKIVERMYELMQITLPELEFEEFYNELSYLKSEQIIKIEDGKLQFFHQTFYDYLYAKGFIAKKMSVMTFINRADQSIMIRSGLKMILNFTRETDQPLYERYLRSILGTGSLRFHIKHLVITMLAAEREPSANEQSIFLDLISKNFDFFAVFCEQTSGKTWLKLLLEQNLLAPLTKTAPEKTTYRFDGFLSGLLTTTKKRKRQISPMIGILGQLLRRNLPGNENEVLGFCEKINDIQTVKWLLFNNRDWKNKKAIKLFEKCFPLNDSDHHGFFMVLEKISHVDPVYVFEKIKDNLTILDRDRDTSLRQHHNSKLLSTLMEKSPQSFLDHVTTVVIKEGKTLPGKALRGEIIPIYNVKDILKKGLDLHDTDNIYKLLGIGMRKQASEQSQYFRDYMKKNLGSEFSSILQVIVFAIEGNEEFYAPEIISLFEHLKIGNALNDYDELNKAISRLISKVVPYLEAEKLEHLAQSMLSISSRNDFNRYHKFMPEGIIWPNCYGRTMYKYLKNIPTATLMRNPLIKRKFGELSRKFAAIKDEEDYLGPARTPVRESAYQNMNTANWINSFLKYNTFKQTSFSPLGGLHEHAERFGEELKKDVQKYLPLIRETIHNEKIHLAYAVKGLQALFDNGDNSLELLKLALARNPKKMELYYLVELCGKLLNGDGPDREIFDYVLAKSMTPNKAEGVSVKDDSYRNEVEIQERAINALMHVRDKSLSQQVFDSLQAAMLESEGRVQKFIMVNSAYLLALDAPKTINLFVSNLSKIDTAKKLNSNAWSLSYLSRHDFAGLLPLFELALTFNEQTESTAQNMTNILMGSWYSDQPGAREIFWKFFDKSEEAKSNALSNAFEYFYEDGLVLPENLEVLFAAIGSESKKVRQRFKVKFLHIEHIKFTDLTLWLSAYTKSNSFVLSDYFLEYLTANCTLHTKTCVDIFEQALANKYKFSDQETNEMRSDESTTKFIIGAYNALPSSEKAYRLKLMKMFDKTLMDLNFRKNAENILDKILE